MHFHRNLKRAAVFVVSAIAAGGMPLAPAEAAPTCATKAYMLCSGSQWSDLGYASIESCIDFETKVCSGGLDPIDHGQPCTGGGYYPVDC